LTALTRRDLIYESMFVHSEIMVLRDMYRV